MISKPYSVPSSSPSTNHDVFLSASMIVGAAFGSSVLAYLQRGGGAQCGGR